jgi:hypothetical protein
MAQQTTSKSFPALLNEYDRASWMAGYFAGAGSASVVTLLLLGLLL